MEAPYRVRHFPGYPCRFGERFARDRLLMSFAEQAQCNFRPPANYKNNFPPNVGIQGDGGLLTYPWLYDKIVKKCCAYATLSCIASIQYMYILQYFYIWQSILLLGHLPKGRVERSDSSGPMLADAVSLWRASLRRLLCTLDFHFRL